MPGSVSHSDGQERRTYGCHGEIVVRQGVDDGYRSGAIDYPASQVSHSVAARLEIKARGCHELATEAEGQELVVDGSVPHPTTNCEEGRH